MHVEFQFQSGTIKTFSGNRSIDGIALFQFQSGTIKTLKIASNSRYRQDQLRFNSDNLLFAQL